MYVNKYLQGGSFMNQQENKKSAEPDEELSKNAESDFPEQTEDIPQNQDSEEMDKTEDKEEDNAEETVSDKVSDKVTDKVTDKVKAPNKFFKIFCGNYSKEKAPAFDDRESKVMYTVKNLARSPLMIGASAMYSVMAFLLLIPLAGTLFPAFSTLIGSFGDLMSNPRASALLSVARALLGIAVVMIIAIPVIMKLFGLWYTVAQGFRKREFNARGLWSIRRSVVAITYIQIITTVVAVTVILLMTMFKTGKTPQSVISLGWVLRVVLPPVVAIVFTVVVSGMIKKGAEQAEYGISKSPLSITMGILSGVFATACGIVMTNANSVVSVLKSVEDLGGTFRVIFSPITKVVEFGGAWVFVPMWLSTMLFGALIFFHRALLVRLREEYFHDS